MSVEVLNETEYPADAIELVALSRYVMGELRVHPQADLCITLVEEPAMETLHVQWMDLPGPTDVMSFPMDELRPGREDKEPDEGMLGDIVLCPSVAAKQAQDAGHATDEELLLLTTHGILHLLGFDHAEPDEEREMFELQRQLLLTFLAGRGRHHRPGLGADMFAQMLLFALLSVVVAFSLAAAESAIFRMSRVRAAELAEEGRSGSLSLVTVVADSAAYLAVLAFLRVVAEATCAVFITVAVLSLLDSVGWALTISIVIMAVVSFVVVGVSPRTLGRQNYDTVALWAAPVAVGLRKVLGPVSRILVALGNAVTPGKGYRDGPFQSEAELRDLLDMAGDTAVIEEGEREMIHSVFELGDTVVREVMVPRTDMVTISQDKTLRQAMSLFIRSGFSRIPVVGDDSDDARGLLYLKDVVRRTYADPEASHMPVDQVMRPLHFVPESKPADDLLREMQLEQNHFAMIVDEYGGTAGLVTIEDILEEIVGEIDDEYDKESPSVQELEDGAFRVPAGMSIDDLGDLFDVDIDEEEVDTVGGLLAKAIGRVPIPGSHAPVAGLSLTAEKMAGRRHRIATVIVRPLEPLDADDVEPLARRVLEREQAHDG